jgi:hypothetical protein
MLAVAVALIVTAPVIASDAFYDARLKAGREALIAQRPLDAVDSLRIATFGLLDSPKQLSEALALLAVAQSATGRTSDLETTISRFVDVETRFTTYDPTVLPSDVRARFESLLLKNVPRQTIAGIPSLSPLIGVARPRSAPQQAPAEQTVIAQLPPTPTTQPAAAPPRTQPNAAATAPKTNPGAAAAPPGTQANAATVVAPPHDTAPPATRPAPATATSPGSADGTRAIGTASQLIRQGHAVEAAALLRQAVAREPQRRDLRLALLEAASLSSNFPLAADQLPRLRPFTDAETAPMFYAAVSLFETGYVNEARQFLDRALPKIVHSPYVDYYAKKIYASRTPRS